MPKSFLMVATLALGAGVASLAAQQPDAAALAPRLAALTAITGYETTLADTLLALLPGSARDRVGNVVLDLGRGTGPRRLVACPMDEPGTIVGGIREDGWLTLRRVPGRVAPLFDQQFEGHRVTAFGVKGAVPGVVGVRSVHLTRGRTTSDDPFTLDQAYLDVGAASRAEAEALGLRVLTPVALEKRPHAWGDGLVAAPAMGRRAACAALLAAAQAAASDKGAASARANVTVAFTVAQGTSFAGLQAMAALHGPFSETTLVDGDGAEADATALGKTPLAPKLGPVTARTLRVRYAGTPVETVALSDIRTLAAELTSMVGGAR